MLAPGFRAIFGAPPGGARDSGCKLGPKRELCLKGNTIERRICAVTCLLPARNF